LDATAKLQGARTDQREAELAIEDFVSAIGEANRQLEVLQTERGEAFTIANRRRERAMGFREAISKKQRWSMLGSGAGDGARPHVITLASLHASFRNDYWHFL